MIRRDAKSTDGTPVWLLIPQTEHAAVAGLLAAHWTFWEGLSGPGLAVLQAAVFLHDDGWHAWDADPALDPDHGRPYQFTEMPGDSALPIWRRSIEDCLKLGPLAGYAVSGHFSALLARHAERASPAAVSGSASSFLLQEASRRKTCAEQWRRQRGGTADCELDAAVGYLQAFDAMSLWLCCAARSRPESFEAPAGSSQRFRFEPCDAALIEVSPWPWDLPELKITVSANAVPAAQYKDRAALRAARSQRVELGWRLTPSS